MPRDNQNQGDNTARKGSNVSLKVDFQGGPDRKDCKIISVLGFPGRPEEVGPVPVVIRKPNDKIGKTIPHPTGTGIVTLTYKNGVAAFPPTGENYKLDLSGFAGFTTIAVVYDHNGRVVEDTADLPSVQDAPPAAAQPSKPSASTERDELFVHCIPVPNSDDWRISGQVFTSRKGTKSNVYADHLAVGTADNGTFEFTHSSANSTSVHIEVMEQPQLSILVTELRGHHAVVHDDHDQHAAVHAATPSPIPTTKWGKTKAWFVRHNNLVSLVAFLLGLFMTCHILWDAGRFLVNPTGIVITSANTPTMTPAEARRARLAGKLRVQKPQEVVQSGSTAQVFHSVLPFVGYYHQGIFTRFFVLLLYWMFYIVVIIPSCHTDEVQRVYKWAKEKVARDKHEEHERSVVEYQVILRKTEEDDRWIAVRYKDNKVLGHKPDLEQEEGQHGGHGETAHAKGLSFMDFLKRDLLVEALLKIGSALLKKWIPGLKI